MSIDDRHCRPFYVEAEGKTFRAAFDAAVATHRAQYGSRGHTGTIADKHHVRLTDFPNLTQGKQTLRHYIEGWRADRTIVSEWARDYIDYNIAAARDYIRTATRHTHTPQAWAELLVDVDLAASRGPAYAIDLTPRIQGVRKPKKFLIFGLAPC